MIGIIRAALAAALVFAAGASQAAAPAQEIPREVQALVDSLHPRQGKIALPEASATLDLGTQYDFYSGEDVAKILVQLWGNPPGTEEGVLGLVMPAGASPLSDAWGAIVRFEGDGYVDDDDAADVDYDELLEQLKDGTEAANEERKRMGYPAMHVVGWAEYPAYDPKTHSAIWARDLKIEGDTVDSLNYDVRTLGRKGVLSINFLSVMPELESIKTAANTFADHAAFDDGWRYEDYKDGDKVAEYGIGGLIAAGVGIAAAQKLGLLAVLVKFGKFIIIGIGIALAAGRKHIARLFGRGEPEQHYEEWQSPAESEAEPAPPAEAPQPYDRTPPPG
jgi:uncharacterized membrane-anchored protein